MIGRQLKAARALIGMEQIELAKRSGISIETIRNMEAHEDGLIKCTDTLRKVRAALETTGVMFREIAV